MGHVVLLGDSIFDNGRYVPGKPALIEQLRQRPPGGWQASLLAVDGHTAGDVVRQLARLPGDATHLFVSAGGNDALGESSILREPARTVAEALALLNEIQSRFRAEYHAMLRALAQPGKPAVLCTVYDSIPGLEPEARTALGLFNEVILRAAIAAGLPVIDLRLVCDAASDYSSVSPIEPSFTGAAKIARWVAHVATGHDFSLRNSVVYA